MFDAIQRFFDSHMGLPEAGTPARGRQDALRVATAALLVEMTRADYQVGQEEREAVVQALQDMFGLAPGETRELVELAEQRSNDAVSLYPFTRLIDRHFTQDEKRQVVEMLWRVAFADAHKHRYEEHLVRKIADLIHVSHSDFIRARHRVEAQLPDKGT